MEYHAERLSNVLSAFCENFIDFQRIKLFHRFCHTLYAMPSQCDRAFSFWSRVSNSHHFWVSLPCDRRHSVQVEVHLELLQCLADCQWMMQSEHTACHPVSWCYFDVTQIGSPHVYYVVHICDGRRFEGCSLYESIRICQ